MWVYIKNQDLIIHDWYPNVVGKIRVSVSYTIISQNNSNTRCIFRITILYVRQITINALLRSDETMSNTRVIGLFRMNLIYVEIRIKSFKGLRVGGPLTICISRIFWLNLVPPHQITRISNYTAYTLTQQPEISIVQLNRLIISTRKNSCWELSSLIIKVCLFIFFIFNLNLV